MSWIAVGAAAVTVVGGAISSNQSSKAAQGAANAQAKGQEAAIAEQRRQYDQTRDDLNPYLQYGQSAIPGLQALQAGDYSGFLKSPDYMAANTQGIATLDNSAAARGSLFSGSQSKDLVQFGQQNASQYLNQYWNRLVNQAATGQNAAAGLGGIGQNTANQIGNAYGNIGSAQAGALGQIGNNNAQFAAGTAGAIGNAWGQYAGSRQGAQQQPAGGGYGAFNPNTGYANASTPAYTGNSAFGQWGQGWGG